MERLIPVIGRLHGVEEKFRAYQALLTWVVDTESFHSARLGCVNADYTFKTRTPMRHSLNTWQQFSSGDLLINVSTRARFYSSENVPAGLPAPVNGMLLNLEVRNVGMFNYDSVSALDAIRGIAQCM